MSTDSVTSKDRLPLPWRFESRNVPIADTGDYDGVIEIRAANNNLVAEAWNASDEQEAAFRQIVEEMNRSPEPQPAASYRTVDAGYDCADCGMQIFDGGSRCRVTGHPHTRPRLLSRDEPQPATSNEESYQVGALRARFADTEMPWTRPHIEQLINTIARLTQERVEGWESFHKLRKSIADQRYPGMTGQIRTLSEPTSGDETLPNDMEEYARVRSLSDEALIKEAALHSQMLVRELANRFDVVVEKLESSVETKAPPCVWRDGCKNHRICHELGCCQQLGTQKASPNLADAINCTCPYESRVASLIIDPLCPVHSPTQNGTGK